MNNEFEGKKQIENPEEFKGLVENNKKDFSNCVFMFAFSSSASELLIKTFTDKDSNFHGAIFSEEVTFKGISIDNPINLSGAKFQKPVIFDSVNFNGYFFIGNCTFNEIKFSKAICKNSVIFDSIKSISNFTAKHCTFQHFELLSSPIDNELIFSRNKFLGKFKVSKNDDQQSKDRDNRVEIITLRFMNNTVESGQLVRFGYLNVDYFLCHDLHNSANSEVNIGECDFDNFALFNLRNSGKFRFYRINEKEEVRKSFTLIDSSLGDSEFQNVNLADYTKVVVQDNSLSDLQYTAVQWPSAIEPEKLYIDSSKMIPISTQFNEAEINKKKRDTYRTLKNVAQKNNDAPQAIEFYSKEMGAYSRTLSWKKGQIIDKLILLFNKWTNLFGLNWLWPIGWILGFGLVLYLLLLLSIDSNDCCICKEWKKFPVFLNPTHKTGAEFICGQWGFWAYLFDLSFRIIEATLIYQTIIAFRKFTRKL